VHDGNPVGWNRICELPSAETLPGSPSGTVSLMSAPAGLPGVTARLSSLLRLSDVPALSEFVATTAMSLSVSHCSIGGAVPIPHLLPYSGSKFAAVGFSQGLCAEARRDGILVTTILPGVMRTGSFVRALFKGEREREVTWFSISASLPGTSISAVALSLRTVSLRSKAGCCRRCERGVTST